MGEGLGFDWLSCSWVNCSEASSSANLSAVRAITSVTSEPQSDHLIGRKGKAHGSKTAMPWMVLPFPAVAGGISRSGQVAQTGKRCCRGAGCYSSVRRVLVSAWP